MKDKKYSWDCPEKTKADKAAKDAGAGKKKDAGKTKVAAGGACDPAAKEELNKGCVKDHRCGKGKAVKDADKDKVAAAAGKNICVPSADCGKEKDASGAKYTIECSATKVFAGVVTAFAVAYTV